MALMACPSTGQDTRLQGLLEEIQSGLDERLQEISRLEQQKADILKRQTEGRFQHAGEALGKQHEQSMKETVERLLRQAEKTEKVRIWAAEQALFEQLTDSVREALESEPATQEWFDKTLKASTCRFPAGSSLQIRLNERWRSAICVPPEIAVRTEAMLGGFRLSDSRLGIEIDATWNRRLEAFKQELWQHWHEQIIQNNQD